MDRWSQLSMSEKSDLMSLYIKNGISSLEEIKKHYNSFDTGGNMSPDHDPNHPYHYHNAEGEKIVITPEDWEANVGKPYFKEIEDAVRAEQVAYPEPEYEVNPDFVRDLRSTYRSNMGNGYQNYRNFSSYLPQGYTFTSEGMIVDPQGNYYVQSGYRQTPRFTYSTDNPLNVNLSSINKNLTFYPVNMDKRVKTSLPVDRTLDVKAEHQAAIDNYIQNNTNNRYDIGWYDHTSYSFKNEPTYGTFGIFSLKNPNKYGWQSGTEHFYPTSREQFEKLDKAFGKAVHKRDKLYTFNRDDLLSILKAGGLEQLIDDFIVTSIKPSRQEAEKNAVISIGPLEKVNTFATGGHLYEDGGPTKTDHVTFGTYDENGNIIPAYRLNQVNIVSTQPYRTPEQETQVTAERNMYFDAMRHFNNGNQDAEGLKETYTKYPELRSYLKRIGMSENDFMSAATGRDYETNSYERERTRQFNKDIQKAEADKANKLMQSVSHQNPNDKKLAAAMTGILGGVTGAGILGGLTSVGQGVNALNTAKTIGKTALNFMGRPVSTLASAQGWTNVLPAATAFDQSLMRTLGLAGVYDATSRGIKGEIPWYDAVGEGVLSGLMTMDLYPALKGGTELVNDAYNQARLLREFSRTIPENEVSNVAQAYKQKIWRNFLNSRNGDNYYRKEIIKSKNNYTPDENYFVSHTTPWQEHIGKENLYGLDAYPKEDLGQVLYEFPTETFGAKLSTDFQGFPTEYSVIDMGKNHLLYGERASGPRDFVKMFDKKMPWGKKSKEQFEIGLTERPLKDGVYDKNPIYEDIYLGNQTTVSGEALKKAMSETTYNEFLNTPYGIQKTLHLGKPTITQYPTLDQAVQKAKNARIERPKMTKLALNHDDRFTEGVFLRNALDGTEIAPTVDAHGISKGNELETLENILTNGFDKNKTLYTAPLAKSKELEGIGFDLGTASTTSYTDGMFILTSKPNGKLSSDGIDAVLINTADRDYALQLQKYLKSKYPKIKFLLYDEAPAYYKGDTKLFSKARKAAKQAEESYLQKLQQHDNNEYFIQGSAGEELPPPPEEVNIVF